MSAVKVVPRNKMNILLVDDRPENLVALEGILEGLGQNLIRAESGPEALKRLLKHDCAVIILDVQMPGMDGYETAQLIRQREKLRSVPIIFVSAIYKSAESISRGYASGAVDYITKPLDPDALKIKVQTFVALAQNADALRNEAESSRAAHEEAASRSQALSAELMERAVVMEREVSAREQAEETLRKREREYRLLFEQNP